MPWNTHFKQGSHFLLPWLLKIYQASAEELQYNNIFIYSKYDIESKAGQNSTEVWKIF